VRAAGATVYSPLAAIVQPSSPAKYICFYKYFVLNSYLYFRRVG